MTSPESTTEQVRLQLLREELQTITPTVYFRTSKIRAIVQRYLVEEELSNLCFARRFNIIQRHLLLKTAGSLNYACRELCYHLHPGRFLPYRDLALALLVLSPRVDYQGFCAEMHRVVSRRALQNFTLRVEQVKVASCIE